MSTSNSITRRERRPSHPGAAIRDLLDALPDMSVTKAARLMGVSRQTLHKIMAEKAPVTTDMALRLGKFFGDGPRIWLKLQQAVDLWDAEQRMGDQIKAIRTQKAA